MRLKTIMGEISQFVRDATSFNSKFIRDRVKRYVTEMRDMLIDCEVCPKGVGGSCPRCVEVQKTIGWALEKLREVEAK